MAGKRPCRVANCSGAAGDPGDHMYNQAVHGPVDFITGDYLAEINLASSAEAYAKGNHAGYVPTALDGLRKTIDVANEKRIKIIINGGALNPRGLAEETLKMVEQRGLNLKVAYVDGDSLLPRIEDILNKDLAHLDSTNANVQLVKDTKTFLSQREKMPVVSANAYLGIRAIKRGLEEGADIVICGRVSDASPVMAAAAYWHGWSDDAYDELAGALIAGHIIECSTYGTGANFSGFFRYQTSELLNLGCPIVEIEVNGSCHVTKHESLNGFVTPDIVKCQVLYELQGNIYLNSDVKADITHVQIQDESANRVYVHGVKGYPPPPTTKLAVFYRAGYQCEVSINATGYATSKKYDLQEAQLRTKLADWDVLKDLDVIEFQRLGEPKENPNGQLESTTSMRILAQAKNQKTLQMIPAAFGYNAMAHFAGMHCTMDMRQMAPMPILGYYPGILAQSELEEAVNIIGKDSKRIVIKSPAKTEPLQKRESYETASPVDLAAFGPTVNVPLGDIALARSGDKGANINIGIFVHGKEQWDWLRSFLTMDKMRQLMGRDWQEWYHLERVELPDIAAVHFVIYGPLGRGVSSSTRLDGLGKGFAEFIRAVHVPVPRKLLEAANGVNGH